MQPNNLLKWLQWFHFFHCVWHSPTQHCTNEQVPQHIHMHLQLQCYLSIFICTQWDWGVCKQAFMKVTKSYLCIFKLCRDPALLTGVSKEKTSCIHWVMHHPIPVSKLQALYTLLQTHLSYIFQGCVNISICPYISKVKHSGKFWIRVWGEYLYAWGQIHSSYPLWLQPGFMWNLDWECGSIRVWIHTPSWWLSQLNA